MRCTVGSCARRRALATASSATAFKRDSISARCSSWDCTSIGSDGGALAIRDGVFYGVESACTLTKPTPVNGMSAMLYDAECNGEGESYGFRVMFMALGDGLAMIQDGAVSELERCD